MIAFMIIRTEMALFDLKEGFCSTSWGVAKRFCCAPHHSGPTPPAGDTEEVCGDWVEWGQLFSPADQEGPGAEGQWIWGSSEFVAYTIVAVSCQLLATRLDQTDGLAARSRGSRVHLDNLPVFVSASQHVKRLDSLTAR